MPPSHAFARAGKVAVAEVGREPFLFFVAVLAGCAGEGGEGKGKGEPTTGPRAFVSGGVAAYVGVAADDARFSLYVCDGITSDDSVETSRKPMVKVRRHG